LKPSTGLSRLDLETGQVQRYTNISGNLNSLSDNYIRAIAEADDGILWIGTGQGINRLDPESDEVTRFYLDGARLTTNEADVQVTYGARQYPNYINDLDILSDGRLLVSTGGAGTAIVDPKARRVTTHVFETPLPEWHGIVGGALESADGRIWSVFANGAGWLTREPANRRLSTTIGTTPPPWAQVTPHRFTRMPRDGSGSVLSARD
jgi:streptogramin lyase